MNWRRTVAALLAGGVVALTLLVGGAPAQAAPSLPLISDCKAAPTPEVPGRGVVGFFSTPPADADLPPAADPFAPGSTTSIYAQYGYAGLRWNTYDLGCGPDVVRAPDATFGTSIANWLITVPKAMVAATGAIVGAAFEPDFLGVFDPLIANVVDVLRRTVFEQWVPLVLAAAGLLFVWRARRASLASTTAAIGWALLVMVVATMVFRWPLVAGHAADATVTTTLGAVTGGLNEQTPETSDGPADEAIAGMHEALLYQAWLGGTFGDANAAVAQRYGPTIFDSQALTWRQAAVLRDDPAAGRRIIEAKEATYTATAARIAAEDPDAYDYLTGRRSDTRVGYALLAVVAALCTVPFLIMAGFLILGALIIVRFGVMLFPAFATLGVFPTMRGLVTGIGNTVASAIVNALVFGIGAAVTVKCVGVLLAPGTEVAGWLQIVLVLLLTVVMWAVLRPFRRLTDMMPGEKRLLGKSAEPKSRGLTGRVLSSAVGSAVGSLGAGRRTEAPAVVHAVPQRIEADASYGRGTPIRTRSESGAFGVPVRTAGGVTVVQDPRSTSVASGSLPSRSGSTPVLHGHLVPHEMFSGDAVPRGEGIGTASPPPSSVQSSASVRHELEADHGRPGRRRTMAPIHRAETGSNPGGDGWPVAESITVLEDVGSEGLADIWTPGTRYEDDQPVDLPPRRAEMPDLPTEAGRGR